MRTLALLALVACADVPLAPPDAELEGGRPQAGRVTVVDPLSLGEGVRLEAPGGARFVQLWFAADEHATIELRASDGQEWTAWAPITVDERHGEVGGGLQAVGDAVAIELRSEGEVHALQAELFAGEVVHDDDWPDGVVLEEGRAISGWWEPPPDVWAIGQTMYLPYTNASSCTGGARPGAIALADFLRATFGASSYGIYNCRGIVGGSSLSVHSEGRAIDLFVPLDGAAAYPSDADNDLGDPIAHFLMTNANALGVSYLIWDRGSWGAHRSGDKHDYYSGAHPHNDHLHIELTPTAAETLTAGYLATFGARVGFVGVAATPELDGYRLAHTDGTVRAFGDAPFHGDLAGVPLARPIAGIASDPGSDGYWLVAEDGGVFAFGGAPFHGSTGAIALAADVTGMAPTPSGEGYWLVAEDGGVFAFGDAGFYGSMGGQPLNAPVVGMAATPSGRGYWLVAEDGGIFAFGDAGFHGSMGGQALAAPVAGIAATPTGRGYWLVAEDGGIFSFGDAGFHGSMGGLPLNAPVTAIAPGNGGYWLVGLDGGVFTFGVPFWGSAG